MFDRKCRARNTADPAIFRTLTRKAEIKAIKLADKKSGGAEGPVFGVFATCDPRLDDDSRRRAVNIVAAAAEKVAAGVHKSDGGGNSVTFVSPAGIRGIAGRISYSALNNAFSLLWDEAETVALPAKLAQAVCNLTTPTWPHTFVTPKYASMVEYKQYAPANHFHMTWNLNPARLEYWLDLTGVLSLTPWEKRPKFIEGTDRPLPLIYLLNGGEYNAKKLLAG